jgi:large subunit ribosomal protein L10
MPSNSVLEQKKAVVADLVEKIKKAQSGVLVQYQGITVENDTKMRAAFRKAGVDYMVIKNTLIGRACDEVGYEAMKENLNGMSAIAIGYDDPIAPAKIAKEYADKVETFEIKGGFLENAVVDANTVKALAEIPSKEVLLARFLGSIQGPISGFARAIQAVIDQKNGGAEVAAE